MISDDEAPFRVDAVFAISTSVDVMVYKLVEMKEIKNQQDMS